MAKLIRFEVENFLSIKEKVVFSMESDKKDDNLKDSLIEIKEENILLSPLLAIYGNNATGKTNLLKAMSHLSFLIKTTQFMTIGQQIPRVPFKLIKDKPTNFTIVFIKNDIRYAYFISFNDTHILKEALYHYPSKKQKKIFERTSEGDEIKTVYPREYNSKFKDMKDKTLTNKLFLGTLSEWVEIDEIKNVIDFFKNDLVINMNEGNPDWLQYTVEILKKKKEYRKIFLDILRKINPSIKDFEAKFEKIDTDKFPPGIPEELKLFLQKGDSFETKVKIFYYESNLIFNLEEESKGVRKFFEIGGPIINVLLNGKILFYDELETSFHPTISKILIEIFQNKEINRRGAQLIFTTHDVNLLNLEILRKDQIWFTEKGIKTNYSTKLTPLSQIRGVRKDENIRIKYLRGVYTDIQILNSNSLITLCGEE